MDSWFDDFQRKEKVFQFSVICKNGSYRTLKIALELSVGSNREVILGCVWVITLLSYLVRVIPSAGLHEIIQQPASFLRSVAFSAEKY